MNSEDSQEAKIKFFLSIVKAEEWIYDPKKKITSESKKMELWKNIHFILKEYNVDIKNPKEKWQSLRELFVRKHKENRTNWTYFRDFQFLIPYIHHKNTSRVQNGENNPRQLNEIATSEIPLESEMEVQISGEEISNEVLTMEHENMNEVENNVPDIEIGRNHSQGNYVIQANGLITYSTLPSTSIETYSTQALPTVLSTTSQFTTTPLSPSSSFQSSNGLVDSTLSLPGASRKPWTLSREVTSSTVASSLPSTLTTPPNFSSSLSKDSFYSSVSSESSIGTLQKTSSSTIAMNNTSLTALSSSASSSPSTSFSSCHSKNSCQPSVASASSYIEDFPQSATNLSSISSKSQPSLPKTFPPISVSSLSNIVSGRKKTNLKGSSNKSAPYNAALSMKNKVSQKIVPPWDNFAKKKLKDDSLVAETSKSIIQTSASLKRATNKMEEYINWKISQGKSQENDVNKDGYYNIIQTGFISLPLQAQKEVLPKILDIIESFY